jgi:hypothetical protein
MCAVLAARDMAAESRHDLELVELTWPALARRQAGPWSRNLSATSKTARAIGARQAGGPSLFGLSVRHSNGLMTVRMPDGFASVCYYPFVRGFLFLNFIPKGLSLRDEIARYFRIGQRSDGRPSSAG